MYNCAYKRRENGRKKMEKYITKKMDKINNIDVIVPGSKSITNRALLLAALSNGTTKLNGTLFSDDSRHFIDALIKLGFTVDVNEKEKAVLIKGENGTIPNKKATINVGSAGTAARFLTAMLATAEGEYIIEASEQMKKRPMKPLFDVLKELGSEIEYIEEAYHLPIKVKGHSIVKDSTITLDTDESTQYLSAMLMIAPIFNFDLKIKVTGSRKTGSYVNITRKMMNSFGCDISYEDETYLIKKTGRYNIPNQYEYQIEPDLSAACYFYGLGAILGCKARVRNVHLDTTQGDIQFLKALEKMGCTVSDEPEGIVLTGPAKEGGLSGITIDMKNFSDQALTMAAVAIYANCETKIENIGHIRHQESDRIKAMAEALKRMKIEYIECDDGMTIFPGTPVPCEIETFEDHRVAMAFTLPGIKTGGIIILNPLCCRKTFEDYFEVIETLYDKR